MNIFTKYISFIQSHYDTEIFNTNIQHRSQAILFDVVLILKYLVVLVH